MDVRLTKRARPLIGELRLAMLSPLVIFFSRTLFPRAYFLHRDGLPIKYKNVFLVDAHLATCDLAQLMLSGE
nr:hypothetical protein [Hyphomonas sp. Mor2]